MLRVSRAALACFGLLCFASTVRVCADDASLPGQRSDDCSLIGTVQSVNGADGRLTLEGQNNQRYVVDAYGADIILRGRRLGETTDLTRGMRVEVNGTLLGRNLVEAQRLRVLPEFGAAGALVPVAAFDAPAPAAPSATPTPATPAPIAPAVPQINLDCLVRDVDIAHNLVTVLGDDDKRYSLDTHDTDIILPSMDHPGKTADLVRGMRVHLVGVQTPNGVVEADRLRVLPASAAPVPPATLAAPAVEDMSVYTGILIDGRSLPRLSRSPAPAIYGPAPDQLLVYPDRSHVPTPDEVQDESIVRYYHTEADADSSIAGSHPLILTARAVIGPAEDAVQLTAEDVARFQALDKRLHFTRNWKVGFLLVANQ